MTDQERIESRISEIKSKMWDKLPPTSLPSGELIIESSLESNPQIIFKIPSKSTDATDESGQFGIRKSDTSWQIYSVDSGEVIKESRIYSKFFDGSDWDPGTSELGGNIFTSSKRIPVNIHEKIDGTIVSAKDIGYKYPQIFEVEWNHRIVEGDTGGGRSKPYLQVSLVFTIRKDVSLVQSLYSINGAQRVPALVREIGAEKKGILYEWSTTSRDILGLGYTVEFSIITTKDREGVSGSSGIGGTNNIESILSYTIQ